MARRLYLDTDERDYELEESMELERDRKDDETFERKREEKFEREAEDKLLNQN